jgi:hypothetical protein
MNALLRSIRLALCALFLGTPMLSPGLSAAATQAPAVFGNGRGANMGSAVWGKRARPDAPSEYQLQPTRYSPKITAMIASAGFGFVRLVATPAPLMADDAADRARARQWLLDKVDGYRAGGLGVIVDLHFWPTDAPLHQDTVVPDPRLRAALIRGQAELARAIGDRAGVALELVNEPPCSAGSKPVDWPRIQREMVARVRAAAPNLPLVLTACRGKLDRLLQVDATPYRGDANILWTVHYYDPPAFIAQEGDGLHSVPFPPAPRTSEAARAAMLPAAGAPRRSFLTYQLDQYLKNHRGQATIGAEMAKVTAWARRYGIRPNHIFVGEFGSAWSAKFAPDLRDDELRWLSAVRTEAERQGFAWAIWGLPGPGQPHYDPASGLMDAPMRRALGLTTPR